MNTRFCGALFLALLAALTLFGVDAQVVAPKFAGSSLTAPPRDWPTNGGDWYNRRYSPLREISRDTVERLKGVWRVRLNGSGFGPQYSAEAQPIYFDGVLYIATGANDVFAIDVDSGELPVDLQGEPRPRHLDRVLQLDESRSRDRRRQGLRGPTRRQARRARPEDRQGRLERPGRAMAGRLHDHDCAALLRRPRDHGLRRRRIRRPRTREGVRREETARSCGRSTRFPGPGELGHDTWPQDNEVWRNGGATVWQTPALDPELGLIYFSTGNAGPDFNGGVRPGDNLFSASIVALDVRTGKYRWHFQEVHHDLWDYDAPNPVVLFDVDIGGVDRKGLAQAGKTGYLYILDRTNGKPLIGIEERAVPQEPRQATAATQPFPVGDPFVPTSMEIAPEGFTLVNRGSIFTPYWTDYVLVKPGLRGGANWPPSSVDPQTGYIYVCAGDNAGAFRGLGHHRSQSARRRVLYRRQLRHQPDADVRRLRGARFAYEQDRLAAALAGALS